MAELDQELPGLLVAVFSQSIAEKSKAESQRAEPILHEARLQPRVPTLRGKGVSVGGVGRAAHQFPTCLPRAYIPGQ